MEGCDRVSEPQRGGGGGFASFVSFLMILFLIYIAAPKRSHVDGRDYLCWSFFADEACVEVFIR
jgi:hypothetical protein